MDFIFTPKLYIDRLVFFLFIIFEIYNFFLLVTFEVDYLN